MSQYLQVCASMPSIVQEHCLYFLSFNFQPGHLALQDLSLRLGSLLLPESFKPGQGEVLSLQGWPGSCYSRWGRVGEIQNKLERNNFIFLLILISLRLCFVDAWTVSDFVSWFFFRIFFRTLHCGGQCLLLSYVVLFHVMWSWFLVIFEYKDT